MANEKTQVTEKPLIQIDDEIREMTNEEYAELLKMRAGYVSLPTAE
jgi:hypothetical protein